MPDWQARSTLGSTWGDDIHWTLRFGRGFDEATVEDFIEIGNSVHVVSSTGMANSATLYVSSTHLPTTNAMYLQSCESLLSCLPMICSGRVAQDVLDLSRNTHPMQPLFDQSGLPGNGFQRGGPI